MACALLICCVGMPVPRNWIQ